jgi:PAS domain S-box-containing protein
MNHTNYQHIIHQAPFGYSLHEIILDAAGEPYDYRFLEANQAFEKLTGLIVAEIRGKTVRQVLPGIEKSTFNWIAFYGKVAVNGGSDSSEQFNEQLGKWYSVKVYSPEKYKFATIFVDVTLEHNLTKVAGRLNRYTHENIDYQSITEQMLVFSGARYASLNKYEANGKEFTTVAIAGLKKSLEMACRMLGLQLNGRKWNYDPEREERIRANKTTYFNHLSDFTGIALPTNIVNTLADLLGIGPGVIVKTVKDEKMVGDFTLVFAKGQQIVNRWMVESYADIVGMLIGRVNAEEEISRQKAELEDFFTVNLDLLCIADQDGNFIKVNNEWEVVLGYPVAELQGRNIMEFVHPDDCQATLESMERLGTREAGLDFVNRYRCSDGSYRFLEWRSYPRGSLIYAAARDVTERKRAEKELVEAKNKAEESDRLKSAFLANMSHEIRTPMNGILGFAELLKEPELTGEEQQRYIRVIEKSGTRMLNIINDIIDISRIESGQAEVSLSMTDINQQMEFLCAFFKPEVELKGVKIWITAPLPGERAIFYTDKEKVYAILTNLIKNAVKFTDTGSISLGCVIRDTELEFYVTDTGTGIGPDKLKVIFERFRHGHEFLNRKYDGAGLGLSISKAYVEMLGGRIWVETSLRIGSTFFFTLPLTESPS